MATRNATREAVLRPLVGAALAGALISGTIISGSLLTPALASCTPETNKDFPGDEDSDSDCLPDYAEALNKTNPFNPDTDGDGITDFQEVVVIKTDPLVRWDRNPDGTPIGGSQEDNAPKQGPTVSTREGLAGVTFTVTDRSGVASQCTYSSEGFEKGFGLPANGTAEVFVPAIRLFKQRNGTITCDNGTSTGTSVFF